MRIPYSVRTQPAMLMVCTPLIAMLCVWFQYNIVTTVEATRLLWSAEETEAEVEKEEHRCRLR